MLSSVETLTRLSVHEAGAGAPSSASRSQRLPVRPSTSLIEPRHQQMGLQDGMQVGEIHGLTNVVWCGPLCLGATLGGPQRDDSTLIEGRDPAGDFVWTEKEDEELPERSSRRDHPDR